MVQINFARKEINCKIVYYGPGLSGKTTNLEVVHQKTPTEHKGELTSISTDGDRTLFFDFMPLDLGTIAGMKTKFHLYTVPGQVYYNSTRKLVLMGADGIIFVADSSPGRMDDNVQSLENLRENLAELGRDVNKMPLVIQYNKRDIPNAMPVEELEAHMNPNGLPSFEGSAKTGEGIFQTLKAISALVLEDINSNERRLVGSAGGAQQASANAAQQAPAAQRRAPAPVAATAQATSGDSGLQPDRDPKQVLRSRGGHAGARAAAPTGGAAAPPRGAPMEPVEPMAQAPAQRRAPPRPARGSAPPRPAPVPRPAGPQERRAAGPAPAPRQERPMPTTRRSGGRPRRESGAGRMLLFLVLGILAGAVAAVFAAKYLLDLDLPK